MSEYVLPELPPDHKWDTRIGGAAPFILRKFVKGSFRNMAYINDELEVKVWKTGRQYVAMGKGETLQQALNMAAALVALGEADE